MIESEIAVLNKNRDFAEEKWGKSPPEDQVPDMGKMAGRLWNLLKQHGDLSVSALVRYTGAPRDYVMEGLGWLGREGKIQIEERSRTRMVSLFKN